MRGLKSQLAKVAESLDCSVDIDAAGERGDVPPRCLPLFCGTGNLLI